MFGIDDAIANGAKLIDDVVDRIWPDATEVEKAKLAQVSAEVQAQYAQVMEQLKINETEAAHPSLFVAGARPAILWIGVASLAYAALIQPFLAWGAAMFDLPIPPIPAGDVLNTLLFGLLGIGGMRTVEKINGVATKRLQ